MSQPLDNKVILIPSFPSRPSSAKPDKEGMQRVSPVQHSLTWNALCDQYFLSRPLSAKTR